MRILAAALLLVVAVMFGSQFLFFAGIAIGRRFTNWRTDYSLVMTGTATFGCLLAARWCLRHTPPHVRT